MVPRKRNFLKVDFSNIATHGAAVPKLHEWRGAALVGGVRVGVALRSASWNPLARLFRQNDPSSSD